ncbi:MAG: ethanolamine ammonia-lyase subunit EutC [Neisseriales bacterium]|nr:MAG: ethanolamine ammonia-lyase subunit EutC [Neisseriales bacterium]
MTKLSVQEQLIAQQNDRVAPNLNKFTNARIAIGHSGGHTRTKNWLDFQLDFAAAKDAVYNELDLTKLADNIRQITDREIYPANSLVTSLDQFLTRPDLGRSINPESHEQLMQLCTAHPEYSAQDILIVISSGLSSLAIENHAVALLKQLLPLFAKMNWSVAPIIISKQTRVAFADKVNDVFKAKLVVNLIGERPGLSSNDSMSIYFTYNSKINSTDEQRNCISNIHRNGLSYTQAAEKLTYLIHRAFELGYSGVQLKDDFSPAALQQIINGANYVS